MGPFQSPPFYFSGPSLVVCHCAEKRRPGGSILWGGGDGVRACACVRVPLLGVRCGARLRQQLQLREIARVSVRVSG